MADPWKMSEGGPPLRLAFVFVLVSVFAACGSGEEFPRVMPANHPDVLEVHYQGRPLREYLRLAGKNPMGSQTAVLAFRSALGEEGGAWLAEVIAAGGVQDRGTALGLLELDPDAAVHASELLHEWLADDEVARERSAVTELSRTTVRIACLVFVSDSGSQSARSVIREALTGERGADAIEHVVLQLTLRSRISVSAFAEDLLAVVERGRDHGWGQNIVHMLDLEKAHLTSSQQERLRCLASSYRPGEFPRIDYGPGN